MATIKAVIKEREVNQEGKVNIKIRITHNRKSRYLSTNFYIKPNHFDNKQSKIKKSHPNSAYLNIELQKIILDYESKLLTVPNSVDIGLISNLLKNEEEFSADFFDTIKKHISTLESIGKIKTSEVYDYTYKMLLKYTNSKFLNFKTIDFKFLSELETYLLRKQLSTNAISIHMRNIRAIYNRAIDENIISLEHYPFRRFKIKKEKTIKRSLTLDQLKAIKNINLHSHNEFARDFFMLSFYLIGANIIDIFNLKDMKNGRIVYKRAKTGRIYDIKVQPEAMELIEKYKGNHTLLNYSENYANANNFKKAINKFLKRVATECEIDEPLTTYYARHTWATIASKIGISKDVISHALGHGNDTVTDIYIDFDLSKVDDANERVIAALN